VSAVRGGVRQIRTGVPPDVGIEQIEIQFVLSINELARRSA